MKILNFYILSITTVIAFVLYNIFQMDILTSLIVIPLGFTFKILFYWGLIFYDYDKAEALHEWEALSKVNSK